MKRMAVQSDDRTSLSDAIRMVRNLRGKSQYIEIGTAEVDSWSARARVLEDGLTRALEDLRALKARGTKTGRQCSQCME